MNPARSLQRIVRGSARRPRLVAGLLVVLALLGAGLALRLTPSTGSDTLVDRGDASFQATERYRERFGDHSIVVLVREELSRLLLTDDLGRLIGLEGCLSGNLPAGATAPGGPRSPCARLAREKPVQVVYGPGTFINSSADQINARFDAQQRQKAGEAQRAGEAARKLARGRGLPRAEQDRLGRAAQQVVYAQFLNEAAQLALRYGLGLKRPRIDDPDFISTLVFDPRRGATTPKARFSYLFPSARTALVQVRLKPGLSEARRRQAIATVRDAVAMPRWGLKQGGTYTVTGAPVVVDELAREITGATALLLLASVLVMAATLLLVFRGRPRLLPLGVALAGTALVFGALALVGASLTMASVAALPVLVGLGVDYAIQYQSRVGEELAGEGPGPGTPAPAGPGAVSAAAGAAAVTGVPTIAAAALATAVGFLVLLLSPVPMVRGFGALLVAGVAVAFALALTLGTAAMALAAGGRRRPRRALPGAAAGLSAIRGAREILTGLGARLPRIRARPGRRRGSPVRAVLEAAVRQPGRVLAVALALAAVGWAVDARTAVVSDVQELVPQDQRALRDLEALQVSTGVAGEVDVLVEGPDLARPEVVAWMRSYQQRLLERFGYSREQGCGRASLCPALSLPDLFRTEQAAATAKGIRALLDTVPPYFSQSVISRDRRTANLAFGIRLMPFDRQQSVMETMRRELDPPAGVRAELAGLPVLAAEGNDALSDSWRRLGTLLAGLAAVALALLAVYRRWQHALLPLAPIVLATGWSGLILYALGIPLNPMSATLGALVLAISTEFSVLLCARYRQERARAADPAEALRRTYASTGAAVLASGATAIAGFAVLVLSDIRMLRDFGFVCVVDLTASLLGVLVVLPAVLVLAERGVLRRPRLARPRALRRRGRPRPA